MTSEVVEVIQRVATAGEMAVTADTLPRTVEHMRQALPGQMRRVETFLNGPF